MVHGKGHSGLARWAALLILITALPLAQAQGQAERLRAELERTDLLIERARDEVAGVVNVFSRDELRKATEMQRAAWREFTHNTAASLRRAGELTRHARRLALRSIEAAGIEKRARESTREILERAEARAADLGEGIRSSANTEAIQLLEQGLQHLRRAHRAFVDGDPRAVRLATLARNLIERAARIAAGTAPMRGGVEAVLDRTDALLAEAEARLGEAPEPDVAAGLLQQARRLLQSAAEALRDGRAQEALRLAFQARERGLTLLSRVRGEPSAADLLPALEDLESLCDELSAEIAGSAREEAQQKWSQGRELLKRGRELLTQGKMHDALAAIVAAEALLREAAQGAERR